MKGLITQNTHVKYKRSSTHCIKVFSKVKVLTERSYHKEYSCETLLARLKCQRGGQNYIMTDRIKTICPLIFNLGGIKINKCYKTKENINKMN